MLFDFGLVYFYNIKIGLNSAVCFFAKTAFGVIALYVKSAGFFLPFSAGKCLQRVQKVTKPIFKPKKGKNVTFNFKRDLRQTRFCKKYQFIARITRRILLQLS